MSNRKTIISVTSQNWLKEFAKYRDYSRPLQDFIEDACSDIRFPTIWPDDKDELLFYLRVNRGACREAIEAFESLWVDYISEN